MVIKRLASAIVRSSQTETSMGYFAGALQIERKTESDDGLKSYTNLLKALTLERIRL